MTTHQLIMLEAKVKVIETQGLHGQKAIFLKKTLLMPFFYRVD